MSIEPNSDNALQRPSQIMIDKVMTVKLDKIRQVFGQIDSDTLIEVERRLAVFLGIVK